MKVRILKRHIEKGQRHNAAKCPIALALGDGWHVGYDSADRESTQEEHSLTAAARAFIHNFDTGEPVKPGWIEVWK